MSIFKNIIFLLGLIFPGECSVIYQKAGEDLNLNCQVEASQSNVEWKFKNMLIVKVNRKTGSKIMGLLYKQALNKYKPSTETLKIHRLEKGDSGVYSCSHGSTFTVSVVSVSVNPGTVLPQSSDAQLQCNVEGYPTENVQWLRPPNAQQQDVRSQTVQLKSLTSNDGGLWSCLFQGLQINITLTVVGLQTKDVKAHQGSNVVLPCSLPQSTSRQVTGGKWESSQLSEVSSATLKNTGNTLNWIGRNTSRAIFTSAPLSTNFDIELINVQSSDGGQFVCSLEFDGGFKLTGSVVLKVTSSSSAPVEEEERVKVKEKPNNSRSTIKGPWTRNVFGVQLWIWIAVGASSVVLIGLIILIVFVQRRNKHMKNRVRKLRAMRQPLTATDYCQCHSSGREMEVVKQVQPVPRRLQQRNNGANQYY